MLDPELIASKPEDIGIDSEKLDAVFARAKRDVDEGILPSAQVAVARHGRLAGVRTFGSAVQGGEEKPASNETLYSIFSSTKAVVAVAVWLLFEDGLLKLEKRVAEIIPEFATNGKEPVTVEQVLLHTGGFPYAPFRPECWGDREALLEAFQRWRLNWEPDSRYEYHPTSAHWVLSEIIYRRTGTDFRDFIRDRVTRPMGLDELFVGMPPEHDSRVAEVRWIGEPVEPPGGWGEVTPEAIMRFNGPLARRSGIPGAGGIASAAELALFYQPLVNNGETAGGTRVIKPEAIEFGTRVRTRPRHVDPIFGIPANRGLSIIVAGDDGQAFMRGFGRNCSPRTFGHGGAGGQIAWGDPESGVSLGYCTNGFVDWMTMGRRITAISSLAGNCAV
ncbi:MAG TPA: serine hydrolase domain-containing protein [Dehalococcoidia bacterium]|nr:serine hydrolase domain-containing protein [Dehalococcoidia bacterium]